MATGPVFSASGEAIEADLKKPGPPVTFAVPALLFNQAPNDLGNADAFPLCPVHEITIVGLVEVELSSMSRDPHVPLL